MFGIVRIMVEFHEMVVCTGSAILICIFCCVVWNWIIIAELDSSFNSLQIGYRFHVIPISNELGKCVWSWIILLKNRLRVLASFWRMSCFAKTNAEVITGIKLKHQWGLKIPKMIIRDMTPDASHASSGVVREQT